MREYTLGTTFDIKFTTRRFSTGVPFTLAGTPAVAAYADNGTTEITAGITLTVDFDARTGLNNVRVVATSGNGYAAGVNYSLVITAGTVDSVSVVGEVVGEFSIEAQSILADVRKLGGVAQSLTDLKDFADDGYDPATNKVQGLVLADTVTTLTNLPAITANWLTAAGIAAGAITSAKFAAGAIDAAAIATDAIDGDAIAASAVTEIQSGLATAASISALNNLSAAQVNAEVDTALADIHLDHLIAAADPGGVVANSSFLAKLVSSSATPAFADYVNTTMSLQANRANIGTAGAGLTNIDLPDQTMNITGNITGNLSGSVGSVTGAVGSVTGAVGSVTGNVGGNVAGSVASVTAAITLPTIPVDWITSSGLAASAVTEIQSGLSTLDAAGVRTAVGLAAANMDTQFGDLPTAAETAAAVLASTIETGKTLLQCIRLITAAAAGKRSGSGTASEQYDAVGNPGTARIVTNADAAGDGTPTLTP